MDATTEETTMDLSFDTYNPRPTSNSSDGNIQKNVISSSNSNNIQSFIFMLQNAIRLSSKINVQLQKLLRRRNNSALARIALANALILERLAECNQAKIIRRKVKPVKMIIVKLIPVLKALLSLSFDYVHRKNNYYEQFLETYYLSDLCNLEERLLRGLNIMGDEHNEPSMELPFSSSVTIDNILTELFFTKYFGFNVTYVRMENFKDAFELEYGKQTNENMQKFWNVLKKIESKNLQTYEATNFMRRQNSNSIFSEYDNFVLRSNREEEEEDDDDNNDHLSSDDGDDNYVDRQGNRLNGDDKDTLNASTLNIFSGPSISGNALFANYQQITAPRTSVYILGTIVDESERRSNNNNNNNTDDSPRGNSNNNNNIYNSNSMRDPSGNDYKNNNGIASINTSFMFNLKVTPFSQIEVKQICCGGQHAAVLTSEWQIFTWGLGSYGRLGHGNTATLKKPKLLDSLAKTKMIQVACGFAFSACVSASGELYTFGTGLNGRLGNGSSKDDYIPRKVPRLANVHITQVSAGSVHTCVVTKKGWIYSFGKFEYAGHNTTQDVLYPKRIQKFHGKKVIQVGVGPGGYHTIALCKDGSVYTWGHNRVGQLGRPLVMYDEDDEEEDFGNDIDGNGEEEEGGGGKVEEMEGNGNDDDAQEEEEEEQGDNDNSETRNNNVEDDYRVSITRNDDTNDNNDNQNDHTVRRVSSSRRSVRRSSRVGRINAEGASYSPIPSLVRSLKGLEITKVVAGWGHSAVVTKDGAVYICGRHVKGQLGLGDPQNFPINERGHEFCPEFRKIESLSGKQVASISCGGEHTAILCTNGDIYTMGSGDSGQLGHGRDFNDCYHPKLLEFTRTNNMKGLDVACGNASTILLTGTSRPKSLFHTCIDLINSSKRLKHEVYQNRDSIGENILRKLEERDPTLTFINNSSSNNTNSRDMKKK